jgi:Fe-S-cluster containining protein
MNEPAAVAAHEVDRQVERLGTYVHTALGRTGLKLHEVEQLLYGLLDVLLANGTVSADEVAAASARVGDELIARREAPDSLVALRVDPPHPPVPAHVDCAARYHVCRAVCCKLDFALTATEIDGGAVRWDLGRPYAIRHDSDGLCHHNDRRTHGCGVYADRPAICRTYSCAGDTRIWKDFERMQLNAEWIEANLSVPSRPRLQVALMRPQVRPARENDPAADEGTPPVNASSG